MTDADLERIAEAIARKVEQVLHPSVRMPRIPAPANTNHPPISPPPAA